MMRPKQILMLSAIAILCLTLYMFVAVGDSRSQTSARATQSLNKIISYTEKQVNKVVTEHTSHSENVNDIVTVAKRIGKNNKMVLVTMVNDAYLSFTYSWLCNTKDMNIHKSVLIITTDKISKENLTRDWPEISVVSMEVGNVQGDQVYSHVGYVKIMIRRTEMLLAILLADLEIFLFEVDCLWFGNPVLAFQNMTGTGVDILVNPVAERTGVYAGGFLYLYTTTKAKELWKQLTKKMLELGEKISKLADSKSISEGDNDQMYLSDLINKRYGGISVKVLPLDIYADGKWYEMREEKRKLARPIIVNNNWVLGNKAKIDRAKKWKHWFIRDDWNCDMDLVHQTVY